MPFDRELEFARRAAVLAGENAQRFLKAGVTAEAKPDLSPVTAADRDNERLLCQMIRAEFPNDGVLGEEGTRHPSASGRRWIIDPIDGTRDFVRGNRFWCVLLALDSASEPQLGVAHFPMLGETYWAARGHGSWLDFNGASTRLRVSSIADPAHAVMSPNGMSGMAQEQYGSAIIEYLSHYWTVRSFGGALDACMLAAGQVDAWIERKAAVWDLAPLQVIIEEAGGKYFAQNGTRRTDAGNAVACAPGLEKELRTFFGLR